ncbi:MAG TPA: hypothetical protein VJR02_21050 [Pyrinomonadaceae bacterium]|nr:hypothetical protein [Pyrinomonadaceae bacterium]
MTTTRLTPVAFAPSSLAVPVTVTLAFAVVKLLDGDVIEIVGAVVSCGFCLLTVIVTGADVFPATSVATTVISLGPLFSEKFATVQVPS